MQRNCDSHRFFIVAKLIEGSLQTIGKGATMLDFIMLAMGLVFFALAIGYTYACDRL
jgi:hypothetical protein